MRFIYLAPAALMFGCVQGAATDETEQAVTSTALASWYCDGNAQPCNFDLGSASNRACALGGVRGGAALGTLGTFSGIGIDGNGHYELSVYTSTTNPLTVTTVCTTPGANKTSAHWSSLFAGPVQIPNTTASSRCFLSQFTAESGGMTSYWDSVRTWRDTNGVWWIGGSTATGYVDGNATCFDATDVGDWAWGQGTSGGTTGNLNHNSGGVACALTELGGAFTSTSLSDGVWIDYVAGRSAQWIWTLVDFKHGAATCFI
jgi:hypothetical protein